MSARALVVGAGGAVGEAAAHALLADGWRVTATMRRAHVEAEARLRAAGAEVERLDLEIARRHLPEHDAAVLTPILTLTEWISPLLRKTPRVVAFSSNNVALMPELPKYRRLVEAEQHLRAALPQLTIIRPTLIYGDARLTTVPRIMRWARRLPVLPMPGSGRALQQPVFHEDLARLAALAVGSDAHAGKVYAAGGPDVVSMRAFFGAIARAAGAPRIIVPVPAWALSLAGGAMQVAHIDSDKLAIEIDALPMDATPHTRLEEGLARTAGALAG